eukprot:1161325-Pelagomonas_calceolata.AAC.27
MSCCPVPSRMVEGLSITQRRLECTEGCARGAPGDPGLFPCSVSGYSDRACAGSDVAGMNEQKCSEDQWEKKHACAGSDAAGMNE